MPCRRKIAKSLTSVAANESWFAFGTPVEEHLDVTAGGAVVPLPCGVSPLRWHGLASPAGAESLFRDVPRLELMAAWPARKNLSSGFELARARRLEWIGLRSTMAVWRFRRKKASLLR